MLRQVSLGFLRATLVLLVLCGCGSEEEEKPVARELVLLNWSAYTDASVLEDFEKETGIKVVVEEYGQSAELISRVQSSPARYDLMILDDVTVPFLVKAKLLAELEPKSLPNFRHIEPAMKNQIYDPGNKYTVPYLYGTTGLAVNTKYVKEPVTSWQVLLNPEYKGKIALFDDPREVMVAILNILDVSINSTDPQVLRRAEEVARKLNENGTLLGDYYPLEQELLAGKVWVTMAYSGDVTKAARGHEEVRFVIPDEGSSRWTDNYALSSHSKKSR